MCRYEWVFKPVPVPGYGTSSTVTILSACFRLLTSLLDKLQSRSLIESFKRAFFWRPGLYKVRHPWLCTQGGCVH